MDKLVDIRNETGSSRDLTLDTSSPPSESFMTANESSSKYFSLSEVDSTFGLSPSKDASTLNADSDRTLTSNSDLISSLSPIAKKGDLDNYCIGKQIEAANILSGGVNIFDDNETSNDDNELVIDVNAEVDEEKSNEKLVESTELPVEKTVESFDSLGVPEVIPSREPEVVLQIDGNNVDAIAIGNGLYLYRKSGQEELAAVQIIDDDQHQPSFKFLKVRENAEGNLEVYEEIEIEVPKEVPLKEDKHAGKKSQIPTKDINRETDEPLKSKVDEASLSQKGETNLLKDVGSELINDNITELRSDINLNGKMKKFNESRKSPVIGSFTPVTYHSTPNKEGIPLTKTMVDQQLHPNRHSDNVKKTIEVHTDSNRPKVTETPVKSKDITEVTKSGGISENYIMKGTEIDTNTLNNSENLNADEKDMNHSIVVKNNTEKDSVVLHENVESEENKIDITKHIEHNTTPEQIESSENRDNAAVEEKVQIERSNKIENLELNKINVSEHLTKTDTKLSDNVTVASDSEENNVELTNIESDSILKDKEIIAQQSDTQHTVINNPNIETDEDEISLRNSIDELNLVIDEAVTTDSLIENEKEEESRDVSKVETEINIDGLLEKDDKLSLELKEECLILSKDDKEQEGTDQSFVKIPHNKTNAMEVDFKCNNIVSIPPGKIEVPKSKELFKEIVNTENVNEDKKNVNEILPVNCIETFNDKEDPQIAHIKIINSQEVVQLYNIVLEKSNTTDLIEQKVPEHLKVTRADGKCLTNADSGLLCKEPLENKSQHKSTCVQNQDIKNKVQMNIDILKKNAPTRSNNNNSAVPFGKWTEANRQEFLNKIKETKIPSHNTNNQLKQPNDLNRRDILKKIDIQRQTSISQSITKCEVGTMSKANTNKEPQVFINKNQNAPIKVQEPKVTSVKLQQPSMKPKPNMSKKIQKEEPGNSIPITKKSVHVKEINNQDLIDKTIEGIINKQIVGVEKSLPPNKPGDNQISLDDIEMKMNELHGGSSETIQSNKNSGIKHIKKDTHKADKNSKIPSLLPFKTKDKPNIKENVAEEPSDEEIIEHEPITGDIDVDRQKFMALLSNKEKGLETKKEAIITEKDFDKFARRNSITYENRLTVNFDGKEPHNVIKTVVVKEPPVKKLSRNEMLLAESKAKSTNKQQIALRHHLTSKIPSNMKSGNEEESPSKQSKVQIAYQSALTAKKHIENPITIIEDKPVKVVYMDSNIDFPLVQLNVQGQELSPSKKIMTETEKTPTKSRDSDVTDSHNEIKTEEIKSKNKHQRKQVLTPVDEPEIELIEPIDLGIETSPKKKRKFEDKSEKITKSLVPKKTYLLNRNVTEESISKSQESIKNVKDHEMVKEVYTSPTTSNTISLLDNLVKAAELIENQSESINTLSSVQSVESPVTTPMKRGRGRPRKYPLPESVSEANKLSNPQKKPRLIDAKRPKKEPETYSSSDESTEEEKIVRENWTMGKINENIVCPICSKLFRSENVVFKHVKHCSGPSPNRSDSDKRSPSRYKRDGSCDFDLKSVGSDSDYSEDEYEQLKRRKSNYKISKSIIDNENVIVIDDTPIKKTERNPQKTKKSETNKSKVIINYKPTDLTCEFCGKSFRQLSYLVNHKLQHKKDVKNTESNEQVASKSVFSCEVCKKQFRKLHHLVEHRDIHKPTSLSNRTSRHNSFEQNDSKVLKNVSQTKQTEDTSAGFRCEPCDKSFRKLHHLVEHRETHDGINKKGCNSQSTHDMSNNSNKVIILYYNCEKCKKAFKKLQEYLDHKDQHLETSSEKSDDKSVKSSLSTKDIIHECSLCYMVFPNEHSLNRHTVICSKKKKSAIKPVAKETEDKESLNAETLSTDVIQENGSEKQTDESKDDDVIPIESESLEIIEKEEQKVLIKEETASAVPLENKNINTDRKSSEKEVKAHKNAVVKLNTEHESSETPPTVKKVENTTDVITISDSPTPRKKKRPSKEKIAPTATKRHKSTNIPLPIVDEATPMDSTDEEEIRYMLNPNFKEAESAECKMFMNVNAKKRSSLQIERPNSKDLVKRRISLQHPPKIPRLKVKAVGAKPSPGLERKSKATQKPIVSSDSDDYDVKYSFPKTNKEETKHSEKKVKNTLAAKRKSASGIAKRKSLEKLKSAAPTHQVKKRNTAGEYKCDCGQLFSSAALLSRHTTLAHTPPRIRRRRSPPPSSPPPSLPPPGTSRVNKSKPTTHSKKLKSPINKIPLRKSCGNASEKNTGDVKVEFVGKKLRSSTHRGVPVPEKMKTIMDKLKK